MRLKDYDLFARADAPGCLPAQTDFHLAWLVSGQSQLLYLLWDRFDIYFVSSLWANGEWAWVGFYCRFVIIKLFTSPKFWTYSRWEISNPVAQSSLILGQQSLVKTFHNTFGNRKWTKTCQPNLSLQIQHKKYVFCWTTLSFGLKFKIKFSTSKVCIQ